MIFDLKNTITVYPKPNSISKANIPQIKNFLDSSTMEILLSLNIIAHTKKKNIYQKATFLIENQTLFLDNSILEEIRNYKKDLIQTKALKGEKEIKTPSTALQNNFPIFQINYKDTQKEAVKKIIGKINMEKLETLRMFELDAKKVDKYNHLLKTNYKKGLNILYYRPEDLKNINFFITKAPKSYRVKKIHQKYKYLLNKK
ncbi:MAG: phase variable surface lipoprotein [Candidatus Phytoplasma stylosanthis]|nr:phase variable surface lipoprotein [Candidatus Phytoplasma stylosanthis]